MHFGNYIVILVLSVITIRIESKERAEGWAIVGNPIAFYHPCKGNEASVILFEPGLPPGEENQYQLHISEKFVPHSEVYIRFDSDATVILENKDSPARIKAEIQTRSFEIKFFKAANKLFLRVKGPPNGAIPYIESVLINTVEYCDDAQTGFLDHHIQGIKDTAEIALTIPDEGCGRRKIQHTELIVNGQPTRPGDWPWHAAIYRFERSRIDYICGGTLLSDYFILTAAHCVAIKGQVVLPETRSVVLGKYNLVGGDIAPQEKEVHKILMHEGFNGKTVEKDIALLKLKTAIVFDDYVQPACLWYADVLKKIPEGNIFGTVVGWGFDQTDTLSSTLQQVTMPKQSYSKCVKSNPGFFAQKLDDFKFCAGNINGSSACNGDSGGGFHVFIPDSKEDTTGAYYVRGIVSLSVRRRDAAICDPHHFVLFTDVAKYGGWIRKNMKS